MSVDIHSILDVDIIDIIMKKFLDQFLAYHSPKYVTVHSHSLGLVLRQGSKQLTMTI